MNRVIRVSLYETLGYVELSVTDCFGMSRLGMLNGYLVGIKPRGGGFFPAPAPRAILHTPGDAGCAGLCPDFNYVGSRKQASLFSASYIIKTPDLWSGASCLLRL